MIKIWQIYNPYFIFARFFKIKLAVLFAFLLISSCSDQGCIEADDFGEYESQTLTVQANASSVGCEYDTTKDITDSSQGSNIKQCLTQGNITLTRPDGTDVTSGTGCVGFSEQSDKQLCIDNCVQSCQQSSASDPNASEPDWTSTTAKQANRNEGITIRPGSQIMIRAVGSVTLGDKLSFPDIFVDAKNPLPHSKRTDGSDYFFDISSQKSLAITLSGRWKDGVDDGNSTNQNVGATPTATSANSSAFPIDSSTLNGARRLVAYLVQAPNGYYYDNTQTTEKSRAKGVLLLPETGVWRCSYTNGGDAVANLSQSSCNNASCPTSGSTDLGPYATLGYVNSNGNSMVDCNGTNNAFPITSNNLSIGVSNYGGMIRYANDGLLPDENDPFSSINCTDNCSSAVTNSPRGMLLGSLSSNDFTFQNTNDYAVKLNFRSLSNQAIAAVCSTTFALTATITDESGNTIYSYSTTSSNAINISNTSWSKTIALEPRHTLTISKTSDVTFGSKSCGEITAMKIGRYYDLLINKSGFISFSMIDNRSPATKTNESCNIKARIINKTGGSHTAITANASSADFYEYDSFFTSSSTDPAASLTVTNSSWSDRVFVRKGQYIRFSPESWNGVWSTEAGARQCGVGMAMIIDPKPALLCRGRQSEYMLDPTCTPKYASDNITIIGCQGTSFECDNSSSSSYCVPSCFTTDADGHAQTCSPPPSSSLCKPSLTCSNAPGFDLNNKATIRQSCTTTPANAPPAGTTCPSSCNNCGTVMLGHANQAAYIAINALDQCYDLEDYKGKVDNIPLANGFAQADLTNNTGIVKGARKLNTFNGYYGNFENIVDSGKNDSVMNNRIFNLASPLTAAATGRVKFFVLDGTNFKDVEKTTGPYTGNGSVSGSTSTAYSGDNGFKINPSSFLQFTNGEWLKARLCRDNNDGSNNCEIISINATTRARTEPSPIDDQQRIIEIAEPTSISASPTLLNSSAYAFDASGNIVRTAPKSTSSTLKDCSANTQGVDSIPGALFYCHTEDFYSGSKDTHTTEETDISNLRLTFKIQDPEVNDCLTKSATPALCGGNGQPGCDGVKTVNPVYEPGSGNTDAICGILGSGSSAKIEVPSSVVDDATTQVSCKKEYYCANRYANNSGNYNVVVRMKNPAGNTISGIIGSVVKPIVEVMDGPADHSKMGQAERMYKLLIANHQYKAIVTMSLVLMFSFYGFGYLIGVSELSHAEIIGRIIKIGLIYLMIGETGWDWFNKLVVTFFKNGTDYVAFTMASAFDDSADLAQAIANNDFYDKSVLFGSADRVFGLFFSSAVQKKIAALLFASIFGWIYLMIIYYAFLAYVYAICNAVLLYLTAQVFISILFTLGPIFFIFTLFNQTKEMFDNWLKQLIGFSLQQIFLLTTVAFFNMMMYEVIKLSLGFKICWDDVWTINIITRITLLSFWTVASMPPRTSAASDVANIGNPEGIPSLFSILYIWIIASLMNKFVTFMTNVAASLGGGIEASNLGSGIKQAAAELKKSTMDYADKAWDKTGRQVTRKIDKALFDSGKLAKDHRHQLRKQNAIDAKNKDMLKDAGKEAINKYKSEHGAEFAGMSKEDQRKTLEEVSKEAMYKAGEKAGLSKDEVDKLKNQKGSTYVGDNVFGRVFSDAKGAMFGTGLKSLSERSVSTSFTQKQAKAALKNTDEEGRKKFMDAVIKGDISVEKSKKAKVADGYRAVRDSKLGKVTVKPLEKLIKSPVTAPAAVIRGAISAGKAIRRDGLVGATSKLATRVSTNITNSLKDSRDSVVSAAQTAGRALAATGRAIVNPIDTSKAAARGIGRAAVNGTRAVKTAVASLRESERQAIYNLEKRGDIRKGVKFRSQDEKKLIREEKKKIQDAKRDKSLEMNDGRTVRSLRETAKLERQRENADESKYLRKEGSVGARLFGRDISWKQSLYSAAKYQTDTKKRAAAQAELREGFRERLTQQATDVATTINGLEDRKSGIFSDIRRVQDLGKRAGADKKALEEAKKRNDPPATIEALEKASHASEASFNTASSEMFKRHRVKDMKGLNKEIHRIDDQITTASNKQRAISSMQQNVEEAFAIRAQAQSQGAGVDDPVMRDFDSITRSKHFGEYRTKYGAAYPTPSAPPAGAIPSAPPADDL